MMSVHWVKADMRLQASRSDLPREYVRSSRRWGVVKSLEHLARGPVGLLHTQKVRNSIRKAHLQGVRRGMLNWDWLPAFAPILFYAEEIPSVLACREAAFSLPVVLGCRSRGQPAFQNHPATEQVDDGAAPDPNR